MSTERYEHDEPIGLYGVYHLRWLAEGVVEDFVQYADIISQQDETAPPIDDSHENYPVDEFRLSTLVTEESPVGYALALAPGSSVDQDGTDGLFYKVALTNRPRVVEARSVAVPSAEQLKSRVDSEATMKDLMTRFDRQELEAIFRMAGKLVDSLHISLTIDHDDLDAYDYSERLQALSDMVRPKAILKRRSAVEPRVLRALEQYNLDDLSALFPSRHKLDKQNLPQPPQEVRHILEWTEFLDKASSLFRRETDTSLPESTVAIQNTVGDDHYLMRFQAANGRLSKIQLLRSNKDSHWLSQEFNLKVGEDEDDLARLKIKPEWDKPKLLEALQNGDPITDEIYRGYLTVAANDPDCELPVARVVDMSVHRKKPAA